jgi:hypothetical protein
VTDLRGPREMAHGLAAHGAKVTFLTARAPGQARTEERDGIPFFTSLVLPRRVPVLCVMHHVHTAQFGVHFPAWMAWAGRLLEGPAARLAYRRQACVAVSPSTVTAMRDRLRLTGHSYLIPNGSPAPAPPLSGAPPPPGARPPSRLVWVGRLVAHKRAELILPVAERGFAIDLIGRGPAGAALAAAIGSVPGRAEAVRLHGFLADRDKRDVVSGSLLHLNTSQGGGWGLCVLEAAALGVPTVAYDAEGLRDAVRDWAARLSWDRSTARLAELVGACVRAGTARGTRDSACVVSTGGGEVVAEGPVLDAFIDACGTVLRPATPAERLLGEVAGTPGPL